LTYRNTTLTFSLSFPITLPGAGHDSEHRALALPRRSPRRYSGWLNRQSSRTG